MKRVAAILLAAGSSSRMGQSKQLLRFGDMSFVRRAAETALSSRCDHLYTVVGAERSAVSRELEGMDVTIVQNPDWHRGIGSSIHAAIRAVMDESDPCDAVLILLVDQPAVDATLLYKIIEKFEEGSALVASVYADSIGVPALFSKAYFDALQNLPDDRGAKALLQKHAQEVTGISFPDGAFDIDTQADLDRLMSHPFLSYRIGQKGILL